MKISVRNAQDNLRINAAFIKHMIRDVLKEERITRDGEIALCVTDDRKIRGLNKTYLGKNRPTDVIAFNLSENEAKLHGDIIVSAETARAYSRKFHTEPAYELYLYVIHGVLHLLGYDDRTKKQRAKMHRRELELLRKFRYYRLSLER
ncbi:MAG: rRNA maturation RNase YbeY [Candidatus Omnitrophota bacterium]